MARGPPLRLRSAHEERLLLQWLNRLLHESDAGRQRYRSIEASVIMQWLGGDRRAGMCVSWFDRPEVDHTLHVHTRARLLRRRNR